MDVNIPWRRNTWPSVNPFDWKLAAGNLRFIRPIHLPAVPGLDVAGEVVELGPGVTAFAVGDRVHAVKAVPVTDGLAYFVPGRTGAQPGGGCAEYALISLDVAAAVPEIANPSFASHTTLAGGSDLYIANRGSNHIRGKPHGRGSVSVMDFVSRRIVATWPIPGGGSPDMGNVSVDGKVLWLSGRYDNVVYAIDTASGEVRIIPVGKEPHGLTVWPQPGRYSLGHTGNMR